ncbi:hypothetical protein A3715_17020 [Oleiphilus sp. HI0009]|nr:hypothetical protein A3715_17020 [Oleiphilus sp. HI0009]
MEFTIAKNEIINPLQAACGAIENKSNLPVLGNVLINAKGSELSITGSNLEVEMIAVIHNVEIKSEGSVTVPAKKLNDICKSFSNDSDIKFSLKDGKALVRSGKSRFTLTTLPSDQYPNVNLDKNTQNITMQANELKRIIDATSFSMGVQDVRYYLNGLLLDVNGNKIKAVSTDGHRLSISEAELTVAVENPVKAIIPRKAISEIAKLLTSGEEVTLKVSENQATINVDNYTFTTKLIDGTFPNYEQVIPKGGDKSVKADRELLKSVLQRASILSHENIKGVQLTVNHNTLNVAANNQSHEQAEENIEVEYSGDSELTIAFNVNYLVDVMSNLKEDDVSITLSNGSSSALIEASNTQTTYVLMPMRL